MNQVIDFINTHRDRYLDELKALLAIPSISALPEHEADVLACAEWCADEMRRIGLGNVRLFETPGHPVVYGDWLGAPGRADDPLLRPLRRAARGPARAVGVAALRGDRARRRDLRARRGRRQGAGLHALQGHRGPHEAERPPAREHQADPRGRGGGRLGQPRRVRPRPQGRARRRRRRHLGLRRCSSAACRRSAYGLRGLVYCQIDLRGTKSDLHSGSFGGAVANPAFVLSQMLAQMKDRGGRIKIPGLLRRRAGAARRGARGVEAAAVQREEVPEGPRRAEARAARPATRRSSARGRARPSRSTACCPGSPARAPRPSSRPSRWPRSACGSCPTRTPTRWRSSSRTT